MINNKVIQDFLDKSKRKAEEAAAKRGEFVLTPEQQRQKELNDAYRRGYEDGKSSNHSWRV